MVDEHIKVWADGCFLSHTNPWRHTRLLTYWSWVSWRDSGGWIGMGDDQ